MTRYTCSVFPTGDGNSFEQTVQVGSHTVKFNFQWAIVSEEQKTLVDTYLRRKAETDPIFQDGDYNRAYDWYSYYISLSGQDLNEWLDSNPPLPNSLVGKQRSDQLYILNIYIQEAESLKPIVTLYDDILKWQFSMSLDDGEVTVGYVQPGGWYRNQDNSLAFVFNADVDYISKDLIREVTIEFEVYDE